MYSYSILYYLFHFNDIYFTFLKLFIGPFSLCHLIFRCFISSSERFMEPMKYFMHFFQLDIYFILLHVQYLIFLHVISKNCFYNPQIDLMNYCQYHKLQHIKKIYTKTPWTSSMKYCSLSILNGLFFEWVFC